MRLDFDVICLLAEINSAGKFETWINEQQSPLQTFG